MSKLQMFNAKGLAVTLAVLFSTGLIFQNCAQVSSDSLSSKASDLEPVIEQTYVDSDQHPDTVLVERKIETSFEPNLADREYTTALMTDIFGPSFGAVDTSKISTNKVDFGSPCSLYEAYSVVASSGAKVINDARAVCPLDASPAAMGADINPKPTVTRQANLAKACTALVSSDVTLAYALKRIDPAATGGVPQPTAQNMQALFRLFYRGKPDAPEALIQSLQVMMDPSRVTPEAWRAPVYTVCVSSHWQEI